MAQQVQKKSSLPAGGELEKNVCDVQPPMKPRPSLELQTKKSGTSILAGSSLKCFLSQSPPLPFSCDERGKRQGAVKKTENRQENTRISCKHSGCKLDCRGCCGSGSFIGAVKNVFLFLSTGVGKTAQVLNTRSTKPPWKAIQGAPRQHGMGICRRRGIEEDRRRQKVTKPSTSDTSGGLSSHFTAKK